MTREELEKAFEDAYELEFAFLNDMPEHEFSAGFERRMNRLIKSVGKTRKPSFSRFHKAALIAAASIVILITAITQVEAFREAIVNFVTKIYETFIEVRFEGDDTDTITTEYQLTFLPADFTLTQTEKNITGIYYKYQDSLENAITFYQSPTKHTQHFIDNEQGLTDVIYISDTEVMLYCSDIIISAYWIQDNYSMLLNCRGSFDEATIIKMIESVKPDNKD